MEKDEGLWRRWLVLMLVSGLILGLDRLGWLRWLRRVAEVPLKPMRQVFVDVGQSGLGITTSLKAVRSARQRLADLERQVAQLTVEATKARDLSLENEALKRLAGVKQERRLTGEVLSVRLVGVGEDWLVASGREGGLKEGGVVVSQEGVLVGRVFKLGEFVSRVRPVTHPASGVEVATLEGVRGVVVGSGGKLRLEQVLQEDKIEVGDVVVTTGRDELYPPSLVVGRVEKVIQEPAEVYKSAEVTPLFKMELMRYVFVLE